MSIFENEIENIKKQIVDKFNPTDIILEKNN